MNNDIQVLWVDDDDDKYLRINAEKSGIKITRFECWYDAKKELDANPGKYEVLLLDCMCKYESNDIPNDFFLTQALGNLSQNIPWLIFTAGADKELDDIVKRLPPDWKKWSHKGYYRKSEKDIEEELFLIIKQIAEGNPVRKIYNKYKDIFTIIEKRFLTSATDIENLIVNSILIPLENGNVEGVEKNIRTVLENFIKHYLEFGLLTEDFKTKHSVNMKNSIMYLFNPDSPLYPHLYKENDKFARKINDALLKMYESLSEDIHGQIYFDKVYANQIKEHQLYVYTFKLFEIFKWYEAWYTESITDWDDIRKKKLSVKVEKDEKNQLFCSWRECKVVIKLKGIQEHDSIIVLGVNYNHFLKEYQLMCFQKAIDA